MQTRLKLRALGAASFWAIGVSIAHVVGSRPIVHCSVMHIPYGGRKGWWNAMNPNSDVGINIFGFIIDTNLAPKSLIDDLFMCLNDASPHVT